jgi:hypothetical protein
VPGRGEQGLAVGDVAGAALRLPEPDEQSDPRRVGIRSTPGWRRRSASSAVSGCPRPVSVSR